MFEHDLADFLANIRASYDIWLREGGIAKLTHASVQGTLAGAISEVSTVGKDWSRMAATEPCKCKI